MWIRTEQINLEGTGGRVAGLVVGDIGDVVGTPHKCLSGAMAALLLHPRHCHVVTELGLVPCHHCSTILAYDPQVSWAVFHLGWGLQNVVDEQVANH